MTAPVDFANPDAVVAFYNAHYPDCNQASEAACGYAAEVTAIMARYLFQNGTPMPFLSWPYAMYVGSGGDATFNGTSGGQPVNVWVQGICADEFYPQALVIANWNNGFPYPASALPGPAAYADAPNQKVLDYGVLVNGDIAQTLRAGIPVIIMSGYHDMCAIAVSTDGWTLYCKDSLQANANNPGGRGIRLVNMDQLNPAAMPLPVTSVYWSGHVPVQPTGGDLSTPQQVIAAIPLVQPPWDNVTYPQLEAATAAAAPIPPAPAGQILPPNPIPLDAAGNVWTWGAFVNERFGYQLLLGGRGLKTCVAVAIVDGVLRANDVGAGGWYAFTGTAAAPAWTPTSAP